ncbi:PAS domain S-box protein [Novispirillum itersonii]|uniref:PAS domain S-box protein n=1 Tax=Novispirillum itersonii TaxID=189 RepID=UPI00039F3A8A|nr:PAS domain S-box protein [Novispirillum itersonii]
MTPRLKAMAERVLHRVGRPVWWVLLFFSVAGVLSALLLIRQSAGDLDHRLRLFIHDRLVAQVEQQRQTLATLAIDLAMDPRSGLHPDAVSEAAGGDQAVPVPSTSLLARAGVSRIFAVSDAGLVREIRDQAMAPPPAEDARLVLQVQALADHLRRADATGLNLSRSAPLIRQGAPSAGLPPVMTAFLGDPQALLLAAVAGVPHLSGATGPRQSAVVLVQALDARWLEQTRAALGVQTLEAAPPSGVVNPYDVVLLTSAGVPMAVLSPGPALEVEGLPVLLNAGVGASVLALAGLTVWFGRLAQRRRAVAAVGSGISPSVHAAVMEALQDGVIVINRTGRIAGINPAAAAIFGYQVADLMGQHLNVLLKTDQHAPHDAFLRQSRLYEPRVISAARALEARHRDGGTLEITLKVLPYSGTGVEDGFIGLIRDVTSSRLEQDLLERIRRRFRVLTENAPIGIYVHRHFHPLFANQTMLDMFGFKSRSEFSALTSTAQILAPEMRDWVRDIHERRLRGEEGPRQYPLHCLRQDNGEDFWCKNVSFTLDWDGEPAICTMLLDITAEMEARREREAMLGRLRSIISTTGEAYFQIDADETIIEVNAAVESLLGWTEKDLLGTRLSAIIAPASQAFVRLQLDSRTRTAHRTYRLDFLHRDGSVVTADVAASSLFDAEGTLLGSFGFCRDISATLAYEKALRHAKEEADRANRAKSDFLSSMSHELRTPLNAILGFAQLLRSGRNATLTPRQKEYVDHIAQSGDLLLTLINEVLDLAKIESGGLGLSVERVSIADLVDHCLGVARVLAKGRNVSIAYQPGANHRAMLLADVTRARQVLLNLLSNAVKYNVEGGSVSLLLDCTDTGRMRFTVVDTGIGIPEDKQGHLFEPFNRLGQEQTPIEGTGIGLTITKALVERMGGQIGFSSLRGTGSTFWFELPLSGEVACFDPTLPPGPAVRPALSAVALPEDSSAPAHPEGAGGAGGIPPCRILYIEDNSGNRTLMEEVFRTQPQVRLELAPTAEIGLAHIRELPPDLILMDLNLPGIDGFAAQRQLRADPVTRGIPVICLSANALASAVERARDSGFAAYLTKPVDIPALLETVAEVLTDPAMPFRAPLHPLAGAAAAETHRP